MHPKGANKNNDDQAIFSKDGPNLIKPALTNKPRVIPNKYRLKNNSNNGRPNFKIETPNNGEVKMIAGTNPINVLINAFNIISPLKGKCNRNYFKKLLSVVDLDVSET